MRVEVHLYTQSQPVVVRGVTNTYTKGPMFCLRVPDGSTHRYEKFPVQHIFRVREFKED